MTDLPLAVVTGATSGIGLATAEKLSETHRVIAVGRNERALWRLGREENIDAVRCDLVASLLDGKGVEELQPLRGLPRVDVLVHAAGIAAIGPVDAHSPQQWRDMLDLNVIVPAQLTKLLLPGLKSAAGTVVFVNSGAGKVASPGWSTYAASKHALVAFSDALRKETAGSGIRVCTVYPGPVDTPMQEQISAARGLDYAPDQCSTPEEIADAIVFAATAGAHSQVTEIVVRPRLG